MSCPGSASYQIHGDGAVEVNGEVPVFLGGAATSQLAAAWAKYGAALSGAAQGVGVPAAWLLGIMMVESAGGKATCSGCVPGCCTSFGGARCCAFGVMQMTAQTAASYGVSVSQLMSDSSAAIWASARLLRDLLSRNGGDFVAALAAYNTGKAVCTGSGGFGYGAAPEYLMKAVTYSNTAITSGLVQKAPSSGAAGVLLSAAAVFAVGFFSVIRRG